MPTARQQELIAILKLEDQLSPGAARAKASLNATETAVGSLDQRLAGARSGIGKFAAAGAQLNLIASTLGPAFGGAVGPIGDTVRVLGNAGLIASTFAELGPGVAAAIRGIGVASVAATPGIVALGAAADGAAVSGIGRLAAALGLIVAPVAAVVAVGGSFLAFEAAANSEGAKTAETLNKQAFNASDLGKAYQTMGDAVPPVTGAIGDLRTGIDTATVAILSARDAADSGALRILALAEVLQKLRDAAASDEIRKEAQAIFDLERGIGGASTLVQEFGNVTAVAALKVEGLTDAIDLLPTTTNIEIITTFRSVQAGAGAEQTFGGGGAAGNIDPPPPASGNIPFEDTPAGREQARQEAIARARDAAQAEARARHDAISAEFEAEKRLADTLFDALHDRTIRAIQDAEKLAETKHSAALQAISDNLKEEQSAHAAPVNAAEQALREREQSQRRRDLIEAQQAAQAALSTNRDPARQADLEKSLRSATEALVNFDAQAAIDRLRAVQAGLDAASESKAGAATKVADDALAAAQAQAKQRTDAETVADAKRRQDFETALEKLRTADEKAGKSPAQFQADLDKLAAKFGITVDPVTGFHHITDPLVTAIKNVHIDPPVVNLSPSFHPIFRVGARDIAIAIQTQAQPASTANVRSGNSGR